MSLRKDNTGLAGPTSLTEQIYVRDSDLVNRLQSVISVLVKRLGPEPVFVTNSELEDAPELQITSDFLRDGVEFRVVV